MGRLDGDPLGGQEQDALDGAPVEDGGSPRPRSVGQSLEALGDVSTVPEVHGRATDVEQLGGLGRSAPCVQPKTPGSHQLEKIRLNPDGSPRSVQFFGC